MKGPFSFLPRWRWGRSHMRQEQWGRPARSKFIHNIVNYAFRRPTILQKRTVKSHTPYLRPHPQPHTLHEGGGPAETKEEENRFGFIQCFRGRPVTDLDAGGGREKMDPPPPHTICNSHWLAGQDCIHVAVLGQILRMLATERKANVLRLRAGGMEWKGGCLVETRRRWIGLAIDYVRALMQHEWLRLRIGIL